ncbi:MAG: hypothetical protein PHS33_09535, partial [Candidatus Omnitrophica bacterium]|nr:hypothetical protein [Candidatus Omnitrophota bacterium]
MSNPFIVAEEDYDGTLGIDPEILDYIQENHEIQSRISSTPCYLLQRKSSGSVIGTIASPYTISTYIETSPNYRAVIWESGDNRPDIRPYVNNGLGNIGVLIDGASALRVLTIDDISSDLEFCVVERKDLSLPGRVEIVFNTGFDASAHTIQCYFSTIQPYINNVRMQKGEDSSQSIFGWEQYLNYNTDMHRNMHQILVRMPLTTRDLILNEEGKVAVEENKAWMIWTPYVNDFDILIVAASNSVSGKEERYEILNKQDSTVQRRLLS